MGFYGNTHELSLNDYFQSVKLKAQSAAEFPADTKILSGEKALTAIAPAQAIELAAGNKWIQFVADDDNAGMNNNDSVAYGVTIYHKKAEGTIKTDDGDPIPVVDFSQAILGTAENPILSNGIKVLGQGKTVSVNSVTFDEAGHVIGNDSGPVQYVLPKTIATTTDYNYIKERQISLLSGQNATAATEMADKMQDYPLSASVMIEDFVDTIVGVSEAKEAIGELESVVGDSSSGLVKDVDDIKTDIQTNIKPALGQTTGISKPGLEFGRDGNQISFNSPLGDDNYGLIPAGAFSTVFNYYNLDSMYTYTPITFSDTVTYEPNKYYYLVGTTYIKDSSTTQKADTQYYTRSNAPTGGISNTNFGLGKYSMAEGIETRAIGKYSHAENGYCAEADGASSYYPTIAYGDSSHAEGRGGIKKFNFSITNVTESNPSQFKIELNNTSATNVLAILGEFNANPSVGAECYVGLRTETGDYGIYPVIAFNVVGMGGSFTIQAPSGIAFKTNNARGELYYGMAYGQASHSEGYGTSAKGDYSHSEGVGSAAIGESSHAEGYFTKAKGKYSHAEGNAVLEGTNLIHTEAIGEGAHAEGCATKAQGLGSHSEGYNTETGEGAKAAHAEGDSTKALASNTHAEGLNTEASGIGAHAEGFYTKAIGRFSHTEGASYDPDGTGERYTEAKGDFSHAEGLCTLTGENAAAAHAEGHLTEALHNYSHASGQGTKTTRESQTVVGAYNEDGDMDIKDNAFFVVGCGIGGGNRKNLFAVTQEQELSGYSNTGLYVLSVGSRKWKISFEDIMTGEELTGLKIVAQNLDPNPELRNKYSVQLL